jgi:glycosyltransferase involved in cell wall biosynthesis
MTKKVNVLMSTYNGEKFLREQIDSVIDQTGVDVSLLVRDDGSKDHTTSILNDYKGEGKLDWYKSDNLGPALSFMHLLRDSNDADYYAFCDQDDFWQKDKLQTAAGMLETTDGPALYFSRTQLTDAELHPTSIVEIDPRLTFGESLVYEFVPGCTMVLNRKLRDMVNKYMPAYLPMHDVWVYSVALAVGSAIFFDKTPHILYRQHTSNTIGQGRGQWHEWHRRFDRLTHSEHSRYRRACEIKKGFSDVMTSDNAKLLDKFISAKHNAVKRLQLCFDNRYDCARKDTRLLFNISLLLNTY